MTRSEIFRSKYKVQKENSNQETTEIKRKIGKVEYVSIFHSEEEEKLFAESCEWARKAAEGKGFDLEHYNSNDEER